MMRHSYLPEEVVEAEADGSPQGDSICSGHDDAQVCESRYDCLGISAIHTIEDIQQAAPPGSPYLRHHAKVVVYQAAWQRNSLLVRGT